MKKLSAILAMAVAMSGEVGFQDNTWNPNFSTKPKKKPIPKGCKEYQFRANGEITEYWDITVFTCIASNEKMGV